MQKPILVIGAGIVGVSAALDLQARRKSVTLIDPVPPGNPAQASFGNAGILAQEGVGPVASPSVLMDIPKILIGRGPIYVSWRDLPKNMKWIADLILAGRKSNRGHIARALNELLYDTIEQHERIAKGTKAAHYIKRGLFTFLYRNAAHRQQDAISRNYQRQLGVEFDLVDRTTLIERDPHLSPRYGAGVDFQVHGWISNPSAYVHALYDSFIERGGTFRQSRASAISPDHVTLEDGTQIQFDQVVLSAGAWSSTLLTPLGVQMPLRAERGYHLNFKNPSAKPPHPYLIMDRRFGFTPMDGSLRAAGTTDLSPIDSPPKPRAHQNLHRFVRGLYPDLTYEAVTEWTGSRPTLSDGLPALGRIPTHPRVICAFGSQHLGLTMGPKLGRIVGDITTDTQLNLEMTPYRPDRFS